MQEYLGIFILIFFLGLPLLRKLLGDAKRVQEKERERQRTLSPSQPPPPAPKVVAPIEQPYVTQLMVEPDFEYHDRLEQPREISHVRGRTLKSKVDPQFKKRVNSSAFAKSGEAVQSRTHKKWSELKKMVVYKEILDPPKAWRD